MRRHEVGLRGQKRVDRGQQTGEYGHAVGTDLAAEGVHHARRHDVEAQQQDAQLQPEADRVGDDGGLEHARDGQTDRDPEHHEQQDPADPQPQPHRTDIASVVLRGFGAAELAAQVLVVDRHRARAGAVAAQAVEQRGETGEHELAEAAGVGDLVEELVVIGRGRRLEFAFDGVVALLIVAEGGLEALLVADLFLGSVERLKGYLLLGGGLRALFSLHGAPLAPLTLRRPDRFGDLCAQGAERAGGPVGLFGFAVFFARVAVNALRGLGRAVVLVGAHVHFFSVVLDRARARAAHVEALVRLHGRIADLLLGQVEEITALEGVEKFAYFLVAGPRALARRLGGVDRGTVGLMPRRGGGGRRLFRGRRGKDAHGRFERRFRTDRRGLFRDRFGTGRSGLFRDRGRGGGESCALVRGDDLFFGICKSLARGALFLRRASVLLFRLVPVL